MEAEQDKLEQSITVFNEQTKIDIYATSISILHDLIQASNTHLKEEQLNEMDFHLTVNYLQLILSELKLNMISSASDHYKRLMEDLNRRYPIEICNKQLEILHRLCGSINMEIQRLDCKINIELIFQFINGINPD